MKPNCFNQVRTELKFGFYFMALALIAPVFIGLLAVGRFIKVDVVAPILLFILPATLTFTAYFYHFFGVIEHVSLFLVLSLLEYFLFGLCVGSLVRAFRSKQWSGRVYIAAGVVLAYLALNLVPSNSISSRVKFYAPNPQLRTEGALALGREGNNANLDVLLKRLEHVLSDTTGNRSYYPEIISLIGGIYKIGGIQAWLNILKSEEREKIPLQTWVEISYSSGVMMRKGKLLGINFSNSGSIPKDPDGYGLQAQLLAYEVAKLLHEHLQKNDSPELRKSFEQLITDWAICSGEPMYADRQPLWERPNFCPQGKSF